MKEKMKLHYDCIEVLEAIGFYQNLIERMNDEIIRYHDFRWLLPMYQHKRIIYQMCVNRLNERYQKILNQLK